MTEEIVTKKAFELFPIIIKCISTLTDCEVSDENEVRRNDWIQGAIFHQSLMEAEYKWILKELSELQYGEGVSHNLLLLRRTLKNKIETIKQHILKPSEEEI